MADGCKAAGLCLAHVVSSRGTTGRLLCASNALEAFGMGLRHCVGCRCHSCLSRAEQCTFPAFKGLQHDSETLQVTLGKGDLARYVQVQREGVPAIDVARVPLRLSVSYHITSPPTSAHYRS